MLTVIATQLPTDRFGTPELMSFGLLPNGDMREHFALVFRTDANDGQAPLVRVHSECVTGDLLGSLRCDCGRQLEEALGRLLKHGGVLVYLRQEGRGIGLHEKLKAYALQDAGLDTFEANRQLGHGDDERSYESAALILKMLQMPAIRLLTRNPDKARQLESFGVRVVEQVRTGLHVNPHNERYVRAKDVRAWELSEDAAAGGADTAKV